MAAADPVLESVRAYYDMTEEQLEVARRHVKGHMRRFGYEGPNVDFRSGYIEDLDGAGVEDESVDVVISNCVVNRRSAFH